MAATRKPFIVGVTGGSGSGKTWFLKRLAQEFGSSQICILSQDNYYKPKEQQPLDENGICNFDTPFSIDFEKFAMDIVTLCKGTTIRVKEYTYNNPAAKPKILEFCPAPIIIVEGIFVFYFSEVTELLDLRVFIDAREHLKLKRRIARDKFERGYELDDVLYRYEHHVAPNF
jgi:uridine kinase